MVNYPERDKNPAGIPFPHNASNPSINSFRCTPACLPFACLPAGQANAIKSRRVFHTPDSPLLIITASEERRVPSNQKYTRLNRACPANNNCRERHVSLSSQSNQTLLLRTDACPSTVIAEYKKLISVFKSNNEANFTILSVCH